MILGLQIIAIIFAFIMIYFALINYKRSEINKTEIIIWSFIWILVVGVVIFPNVLRSLSERFFITRLFDFLVVGGFVLVIGLVSIMYIKVRRMEHKLEKYVREEALKDVKKKKK
ncbi:DUF2304 family protein [Patescibacteria group bacterium]